MSDILDALRKAELQREHARGPGLSTQQHYAVTPSAHPVRWLWGAAAAFVLGISSAWLLAAYAGRGQPAGTAIAPPPNEVHDNGIIARPQLRPPGPRRAPEPAVEAAAAPVPVPAPMPVTAAVPAPAAEPAEAPDIAPPAPAAEAEVPPVSVVPPPPAEPVPAASAARRELAMIRDPFTPPSRPAPQRSVRAAPAPLAEAPPAEDPVPLLRTLPYRFQSMVPKLVINAQAYARASEERFVIINMKKYGEGEQTVEGVRIEAIREQDIVLDYQGQQFRLQR